MIKHKRDDDERKTFRIQNPLYNILNLSKLSTKILSVTGKRIKVLLLLFTRRYARVRGERVCVGGVTCVCVCGGGASCYYLGVVVKPISGVYDVTFTSSAVLALHHAAPAAMTRTGRAWSRPPHRTDGDDESHLLSLGIVSLVRGGRSEVENPSEKTKQKNCKNMQKENTRL